MAPTKKKRKPITNPARGFATTSVASKPKAVKDPEGTESLSAPPSTKSLDSVLASTSSNDDITKPTPTVETSKLSPEEYAKYLETGELQQLVEKYATKVKRDVARQVLRLQSDRRVLRGQAESLNIRRWLSKEITDEIIGIIRDEWGRERAGEGYVNTVAKKPAGEEESSVRLWTLKLVLAELGVSAEGGEGVLKVLVESELAVGTGKDAVWGLDEALEWLALYHGKDELENYEFKPVKTALRVEGSAPAELLIDKPDISSTSHPDSDNEVSPTEVGLG
jgi:ATP-dependent RNA helicase DHX29